MGQKMSSGNDLLHTMKKLRLTDKCDSRGTQHDSVVSVAYVGISSPHSPFRKPSGRHYSLLECAMNAPFEDIPNVDNCEDLHGTATIDNHNYEVTPLRCVDDSPVLDHVQQLFTYNSSVTCATVLPSPITAPADTRLVHYDDSFSDKELSRFLRMCRDESEEIQSNASSRLEHSFCFQAFTDEDFRLHSKLTKFVELSDDDLIEHLKKK